MSNPKPSILVADDTPTNLDLLGALLEGDYELLFAGSGSEALELTLAHSPDLVLMDILMPEMDGYEVCRRLKADVRTRDIPIIFISALDQEADEALGLELGAIDFISKPFSPPIVRARIRNHMELKQQRDILRGLSFLDGLTGIANRRRFDEVLDREWRRHVRNQVPLSLIMMDIDLFKAFNDSVGHLHGDECLRQVAQTLATIFQRPGDLVARYGGEEFVAILAETSAAGAQTMAESVQEALAALALPHPCSAVSPFVTLSLGVASRNPEAAGTAESLLQDADSALYRAKESGRNRSILAGG